MASRVWSFLAEILRAFGPPAVVFIWTYYFWAPITHNFTLLSAVEIVLVILIVFFSAGSDALISWRSHRASVAIIVSYVCWLLLVLIMLTIGSERLAGSGLLGLYALTAF